MSMEIFAVSMYNYLCTVPCIVCRSCISDLQENKLTFAIHTCIHAWFVHCSKFVRLFCLRCDFIKYIYVHAYIRVCGRKQCLE